MRGHACEVCQPGLPKSGFDVLCPGDLKDLTVSLAKRADGSLGGVAGDDPEPPHQVGLEAGMVGSGERAPD
eukprot:5108954-Alexandrium_andersonii.AAC.1